MIFKSIDNLASHAKMYTKYLNMIRKRPRQINAEDARAMMNDLADDVVRMTKGLQERTQLIEWDDNET